MPVVYQIRISIKLYIARQIGTFHFQQMPSKNRCSPHFVTCVNQCRDACKNFNMRSCHILLFTTSCRWTTRASHDKKPSRGNFFAPAKKTQRQHTAFLINLIGNFDNVRCVVSKDPINFLSVLKLITMPASLSYDEICTKEN